MDGAESAVPHPWVPPLQEPLQQGPVAVDLEFAGATVLAEAEAVHLEGVARKLPENKGQKYYSKKTSSSKNRNKNNKKISSNFCKKSNSSNSTKSNCISSMSK